jgi:hypothetical protein
VFHGGAFFQHLLARHPSNQVAKLLQSADFPAVVIAIGVSKCKLFLGKYDFKRQVSWLPTT